jgi:hypothetical protein
VLLYIQINHSFEVAECKSLSDLIGADASVTVQVKHIKCDFEICLVEQLTFVGGTNDEFQETDFAIAVCVKRSK